MDVPEPFLQAIVAAPDDDAPRLAFAEHLEKQGDWRGEFIRLQCAVAALDRADPYRIRFTSTDRRLHRHGFVRRSEFAEGVSYVPINDHRGMLEEFYGDCDDFLAAAATLMDERRFPLFNRVDLIGEFTRSAEFAACQCLRRVRSLRFMEAAFGDLEVQILLASPHLSNLRELSFGFQSEESEKDTILRYADLITAAGAELLANAQALSELQCLDLSKHFLRNEGALALAKTTCLHQLRRLELSDNRIEDEGVVAIAESSLLSNVRVLGLRNNSISADGAAALLRTPAIGRLEVLELSNNAVDGAVLKGVAPAFREHRLRSLYLGGNVLRDHGLRHLVKLLGPAPPRTLNLDRNEIGDQGFIDLVSSGGFASIQELAMTHNEITDDGLSKWVSMGRTCGLTSLHLNHNRIGDVGIAALVSSPVAGSLHSLWLAGNHLGVRGVAALLRSPYVESVDDLFMDRVGVSEEDLAALRTRFRDRIRFL